MSESRPARASSRDGRLGLRWSACEDRWDEASGDVTGWRRGSSRRLPRDSDLQVDVAEEALPAGVHRALQRTSSSATAAVQEHQVRAGTIPEAGLLELERVSDGGSRGPFGSRNR